MKGLRARHGPEPAIEWEREKREEGTPTNHCSEHLFRMQNIYWHLKQLGRMCCASKRYARTTEEEHPRQTPTHLTWGRTPWVYDELFFHPGSLLRDHHPSFPTPSSCTDYGYQGTRTSALAAGVRTVRAGCCCGRRGAATSEEFSGNLQWVPYPEMAPVAAEAGLYWSNASYVPGIAQGVQEFKFC